VYGLGKNGSVEDLVVEAVKSHDIEVDVSEVVSPTSTPGEKEEAGEFEKRELGELGYEEYIS
jgi:hypothetical protein